MWIISSLIEEFSVMSPTVINLGVPITYCQKVVSVNPRSFDKYGRLALLYTLTKKMGRIAEMGRINGAQNPPYYTTIDNQPGNYNINLSCIGFCTLVMEITF